MTTGYFPGLAEVPQEWSATFGSRLQAIVNMLVGKANCAADLTLTAGTTTTTMTDARLSAFSVLSFMPTTANARTAKPNIYVTGQKKGAATINHANVAAIDQTFRVAILG